MARFCSNKLFSMTTVLFHLVGTSCCSRLGCCWGLFSFWMSNSLEYASGECLKWPTMRRPIVIKSMTARCAKTPSFTASWSVCAMHGRLGKPASFIAFAMLLALSRRMTHTFPFGIPHAWNMSVNALAMAIRRVWARKLLRVKRNSLQLELFINKLCS